MVKKATVPAHGHGKNAKARHGGTRNFTKSSVDSDMLSDSLKGYVAQVGSKLAFNFQEYNSTWANCAVRGKALANTYEFTMALLEVDPKATVVYLDVKQAVVNTLLAVPEAKIDKNESISDQAGRIARRAIVIQNHLRKMCTGREAPDVYQRCHEECANHPELRSKLQEMHGICEKAWSPTSSVLPVHPSEKQSLSSWFADPTDIDGDDDEFDLDLKFLGKLQGKGSTVDALADASGSKTPLGKKPAANLKKKPSSDLPDEDKDPVIDVDSVKLEGPYPNGKCYIRHVQGGKKKSLVNLDRSDACKDNGGIVKKVLKYIKQKPGCRKSEAIAEKMRLLKK